MKPKIAFVQNVPFSDHRMVHTDGVSRELIRRGYGVDVIIQRSTHGSCFTDVPYNVIEVPGNTYSVVGQVLFIFRLFFLLRGNDYDVIHAKNPFSSVLPALLCKCGAKVVYDVRGLWIDFGVHSGDIPGFMAPLLWRLDLWCMRRADRVIAISHELKKELVKRGVDEEHVEVIVGDGVDFEGIQSLEPRDIREYLGFKGEVVGYVGTISRSRFSEKIIEAFKYVHDEVESAKLVMIGPCKEMNYFSKLIDELSLTNSVFLPGFINSHDEVLRLIKSMDVLVSYHQKNLPCFNVMVPTKILEYLACGRPIIATEHIAHTNILKHGYNAVLTNQDPKSFAKGIIQVLMNEKLSKKLATNASLTVKQYSIVIVTNKVEDLYNKLF